MACMNIEQEKHNQRDKRRDQIVGTAWSLFLEVGFKNTTMALVASKSGISRKTLYQYFKSKEEIATVIDMQVLQGYGKIIEEALPKLHGNGHNKLKQYFELLDDNLDKFKEKIIFTGIYDHHVNTSEVNPTLREEFYSTVEKVNSYIINILKEGISDGSIKNIDPFLAANTIGDSWLSLAQRVFGRHESLDMAYLETRKMITLQLSLFLSGLKGENVV